MLSREEDVEMCDDLDKNFDDEPMMTINKHDKH
jgi:hypothetical protein